MAFTRGNFWAGVTKSRQAAWLGRTVTYITKGPDLINNEALSAINAAGTGEVDIVKVNASDQIEFAGGTTNPIRLGASAITALVLGGGNNTTPLTTALPDLSFIDFRFQSTATSGTSYGQYVRLAAGGAGQEAIAGRSKVLLTANSVGNAHGQHDTLELDTSLGSITGLGTGHRANLVLPARAVLGGTYFGAMAEIFCNGANASIAGVTKHAVFEICVGGADATAMNTVKNAISFDHGGTDGTGQMIYTHTVTAGNGVGSIRVLVNGVARWIQFYAAE